MNDRRIREAIADVARQELRWEGPLPAGDLRESLDSLQRLTLVVALEDRLHVCLDPTDEEAIRTVEDLVRVLAAREAP